MLWVRTFSPFLPSLISSCAVWANSDETHKPASATAKRIFRIFIYCSAASRWGLFSTLLYLNFHSWQTKIRSTFVTGTSVFNSPEEIMRGLVLIGLCLVLSLVPLAYGQGRGALEQQHPDNAQSLTRVQTAKKIAGNDPLLTG